jgi:PDZ domain-containing protein
VWRNGVLTEVTVTTVQSSSQPGVPIVGITVDPGYKYTPRISFDLGQRIGGPSAGLVFALAIYDKITAGPLLAGRHVAGTGTITPNGDVGAIGGIQEKIGSAEKQGATTFLVPAANCDDLAGLSSKMKLIKVATLDDAVSALQLLDTPDGAAHEPTCP